MSASDSSEANRPSPNSNEEQVRSKKRKQCILFSLLIVVFLAIIICSGVFLYLYLGKHGPFKPKAPVKEVWTKEKRLLIKETIILDGDKRIGVSPGYLQSALKLHERIDESVQPCDDFFEHACSKYLNKQPIPAHRSEFGDIGNLREKAEEDMKTLLDSTEDPKSKAIQKMKHIYNSCLKEEEYVHKGPEEVLKAIRSFGVWPMLEGLDNYNPKDSDLQTLLEKLAKEQLTGPGFFSFSIARDPKNLTRQILTWDQGELLMIPEYYRNRSKYSKEFEATRKNLLDKIKFFAKAVNIPENPNLEKELDEILEFETEIAGIVKLTHERRDYNAMYNLQSFESFCSRMVYIMGLRIKDYALALFPKVAHDLVNAKDTQINIMNLNFDNRLSFFVVKSSKNPRILHNYEMLRLFLAYGDFYGPAYRDISFELKRTLQGVKEQNPWWKTCNGVAQRMPKAYGALYARNYFDEESKESLMKMIENLKASFMELLDENEWMDDKTREQAKKKAQEMIPLIGYNELAFDDEGLDKYYEKLDISPSDDFMAVLKKLEKFDYINEFEKLMGPRDRHDFFSMASVVNAFHGPESNAILFPAAILQFPFFLKDQPQAMNYGSIGSIIGHEITHGFDDMGKDFDDQGNLRNWWGNDTKQQYEEKAQCIIDQYGQIEVPGTGMKINGKLTAGENIADSGGIREAFRAYQKFVKENGDEPSLPGLVMPAEQAFFYGYSGFFCMKFREGSMKRLVTTDSHSPVRYRINVVLQNTPEFSQAFQCPEGSPMNPEKKCSVW